LPRRTTRDTLSNVQPILGVVPIFAGLADEALSLLLKRAEETSAAINDIILREGEPGSRFYLIKSGAVRVVKKLGAPDEVLLARLTARDFFGEMCILETLPRAASVQAIEPTELINIPSTAFYHLYKDRPDQYSILLLNIARDLSRRLRRLDDAYAASI
jgi:CRP/FNR family transcriptional regulator, cyclic AMP receptor protein